MEAAGPGAPAGLDCEVRSCGGVASFCVHWKTAAVTRAHMNIPSPPLVLRSGTPVLARAWTEASPACSRFRRDITLPPEHTPLYSINYKQNTRKPFSDFKRFSDDAKCPQVAASSSAHFLISGVFPCQSQCESGIVQFSDLS